LYLKFKANKSPQLAQAIRGRDPRLKLAPAIRPRRERPPIISATNQLVIPNQRLPAP
jgi:hypothetical protein